MPPYYSQDFFTRIQKVHEESPLNILKMKEKDWYRVLLEDYCTMEIDNNTGERVGIPRMTGSAAGGWLDYQDLVQTTLLSFLD